MGDKTQEPDVREAEAATQRVLDGAEPDVSAALDPPEVVDAEVVDFAPTGADLVITEPEDTFAVLDRHDEQQILMEITKRGIKRLFYEFPQDGKTVVGLSIFGVLECVGLMNRTGKVKIAVDSGSANIRREVIDGEEYVIARVYAHDAVTGFGVFGTSSQPFRMKLRPDVAARKRGKGEAVTDDDRIFDKFAETKALSKAQRNALGQMIPQMVVAAMIAQATQNPVLMREVRFGVGAAQEADRPALDSSRARELVREATTIYDELRGVNVKALLPGQFNAKLTNAHHSEDELGAFVGALRSQLEHEKGQVAS